MSEQSRLILTAHPSIAELRPVKQLIIVYRPCRPDRRLIGAWDIPHSQYPAVLEVLPAFEVAHCPPGLPVEQAQQMLREDLCVGLGRPSRVHYLRLVD